MLKQEQKLRMSPQLLQSIHLMALPILDLRTKIQEEIEKNPALEMIEDPADDLQLEEQPRKNTDILEYFENTSDPGYNRGGYDEEAGDAKRRFMEGALARPESLQEHLLWQLSLQPISEELHALGELAIRNLDENGFFIEPLDKLVAADRLELLKQAVEIVQTFEPLGVAVSDYRESLLLQTRLRGGAPEHAEEVLRDHLEPLEKGRIKEIARKLKVSEEQIERCLAFIKTLTPFPGRLFSNEAPTYVVPDLMVKLREGQFVIILNDEEIPVLGVNPFFSEMKADAPSGKDVKKYVSEKLKDAQWFISSIHQRNQTLLKVAQAIIEFQREFFIRGPKYIRPLTLKDIAQEIGVHEATVSRITTSKYVQTEWGIFELKYFFSNSVSGAGPDGANFSKRGVKEILREIIEKEGGQKNLSDQKLVELLSNRGIKIARRTVAKYRNELDIGSSYGR